MWKSNNQGVKEETFTQTGRRGRDRQQGWRGLKARQWLEDWAVPHLCADQTGRNNWGARQTTQTRVPVQGNKASKPLTVKTYGSCGSRRNSQPHRRAHWRDPQGPRIYTNPPTQELALEGPNG